MPWRRIRSPWTRVFTDSSAKRCIKLSACAAIICQWPQRGLCCCRRGERVEYFQSSDSRATHATPSPSDGAIKQAFYDGIDALPVGLAVFDVNDRLILGNRAFREMLPDDAKLYDAGMLFPDVARRTAIEVYGVAEAEASTWLEARLAYRRNPDGHFDQQLIDGRWFRIQESRTSDAGTVTNWTDITDLKRQEQAAERYADELMLTNSHLDEFARAGRAPFSEMRRRTVRVRYRIP